MKSFDGKAIVFCFTPIESWLCQEESSKKHKG